MCKGGRKKPGPNLKQVEKAFAIQPGKKSKLGWTWDDIRQSISVTAKFKRPPVAVSTRDGSLISHAPSIACLARLIGFRVDAPEGPAPPLATEAANGLAEVEKELPRNLVGIEWAALRKGVRRAKTQREIIEATDGANGILAQYIRLKARTLRPSTLKAYASRIGNHLLPHFEEDPHDASPEELLEIVEIILLETVSEDCDGGNSFQVREMMRRALLSFFKMLAETRPKIWKSEVMSVLRKRTLQPVDANLITLDELERVLARVSREVDNKSLRMELRVFYILMWSSGLRRGETLHLRANGFIDDLIYIHPTEDHALKTTASCRNIPWRALVTDRHFKEVDELVQQKASLDDESFLFSNALSSQDHDKY